MIRIDHHLPEGWKKEMGRSRLESLYAHCREILVKEGDLIKKDQQIGTIGDADGLYYAHLHFVMRWNSKLPIGPGYSIDTSGYLDPTVVIQEYRSIGQ